MKEILRTLLALVALGSLFWWLCGPVPSDDSRDLRYRGEK